MQSSSIFLIVSLFTASFLGSWHCAVMCGPVACFVSNQGQIKLYHLGRLITYTLLGGLAGAFGEAVFDHFSRQTYLLTILIVTAVIVVSSLVRLDIIKLNNKYYHLLQSKSNLLLTQLFKKWAGRSSFVVGLLTGFLPCSWLFVFVFSAITTHSAISGAFVLFIFWLGGLPALIAVSSSMTKLIKKSPTYHQKIAGIILIIAAVFSTLSFAIHLNN